MDAILRLAAHVTSPIGLTALVIAALFGLYLAILKLPIFPRLPQNLAFRLLRLIALLGFWIAVVIAVFWYLGTVFPRPAADAPSKGAVSLRDSIVEVEVRNAPLQEILQSCARQVGAALVLDKNLRGNLSISDRGKLSGIMNGICEAFNCTWTIVDGNPPALLVRPKAMAPASG